MIVPNLVLLLTAATSALAIPAAMDNSQQVRFGTKAGSAALNWGAGAVSKIGGGGGGVETNTVWNWANCGRSHPCAFAVCGRVCGELMSPGCVVSLGEEGDAVTIKSVKVSPDPPRPGHNLTIYAEGTVNNDIEVRHPPSPPLSSRAQSADPGSRSQEGSYADVVVKLGLIKLLTKRFDICEELGNANATLQCPIVADEYSIEQTVELPEEIPRG